MSLLDDVKKYGSVKAAAKENSISPSTFRRRLAKEKQESIRAAKLFNTIEHSADQSTRYFILTSAQDKTKIHLDFWNNLLAYAEYLDAEVLVAPFTYSKKLFSDPNTQSNEVWYDERIEPYIVYDRVAIGDHVHFCAEMNTLPTAVQPLSGLESYTKDKWGIFPHAKIQLSSVANMKNALSRQIMTTGAVTLPNYIHRKAGMKAEFHHQIAAVVVSIDPDGAFFCRHIQATDSEDGSFYDLDKFVSGGNVTEDHRVDAVVYGDIHIEKIDPEVAWSTWGYSGYVTTRSKPTLESLIKPRNRIFHDLIDFSARNHHNIKDHHFRLHSFFNSRDSVKDNINDAVEFLNAIKIDGVNDIVIQSNHDNALSKWLKADGVRNDPNNYVFWLECELAYVKALQEGVSHFPFEHAMTTIGVNDRVKFVQEYSGYTINDIELSIHGHYGANGGRGSLPTFAKMGVKSITAHGHAPGIIDGAYRVGTNSSLDLGYNTGLSSWSHTNAIIYPNGQRTLITMSNNRWFDAP